MDQPGDLRALSVRWTLLDPTWPSIGYTQREDVSRTLAEPADDSRSHSNERGPRPNWPGAIIWRATSDIGTSKWNLRRLWLRWIGGCGVSPSPGRNFFFIDPTKHRYHQTAKRSFSSRRFAVLQSRQDITGDGRRRGGSAIPRCLRLLLTSRLRSKSRQPPTDSSDEDRLPPQSSR